MVMRWTPHTLIAAAALFVIAVVLLIVREAAGLGSARLGPLIASAWILTALMIYWHVTGRMIELHVLRRFNRVNLVLGGVTALLWIGVVWLSAEVLPGRREVILLATPLTVAAGWSLLSGVFFMLKPRHVVLAGLRILTIVLLTITAVHLAVAIPYGLIRVPSMTFMEEQQFFHSQLRFGMPVFVFGMIAGLLAVGGHGYARLRARERGDLPRESFRAVCPRCERSRMMQTEGDQCPNCGLMIKLKLP